MPAIDKKTAKRFLREKIPLTPDGWLIVFAIVALLWTLATLYWGIPNKVFLSGLIALMIITGILIIRSSRT